MTSGDDEMTSGDDEMTSGDDEMTSGDDEMTSGDGTAVDVSIGLEELDSYRLEMLFSIDGQDAGGNEQSGTVDMMVETDNTTGNQHISFSGSGPAFEMPGMPAPQAEMYVVDGKSYILGNIPGSDSPQCMLFPGQEQPLPMDPRDLVEGLEGANLIEEGETVNGVVSDHYSIDQEGAAFGELETVEEASGDIWIAQDGGYLVKMDAEVVGTDQSGVEGTFNLQYDLTNVNSVGAIELPEACENAIDPSTILPDMENMPDMEDMPDLEDMPERQP
jgi:hypothetical protein